MGVFKLDTDAAAFCRGEMSSEKVQQHNGCTQVSSLTCKLDSNNRLVMSCICTMQGAHMLVRPHEHIG